MGTGSLTDHTGRRGTLGVLALALLLVVSGSALTASTAAAAAWLEDAPVAEAAMRGDTDTVRALLRDGADVNAPQGDGMTALHWTAMNDDTATLEVLLYAGAALETTTRLGGYTPLHLAARAGSSEAVAALLEAGSRPDKTTSTGVTPLHLAAQAGAPDAVAALLASGAEIDAPDGPADRTPLMYATANGRLESMRLLIAAGADVSAATRVVDYPELDEEDTVERRRRARIIAAREEPEEEEEEEDEDERRQRAPAQQGQQGGAAAGQGSGQQGGQGNQGGGAQGTAGSGGQGQGPPDTAPETAKADPDADETKADPDAAGKQADPDADETEAEEPEPTDPDEPTTPPDPDEPTTPPDPDEPTRPDAPDRVAEPDAGSPDSDDPDKADPDDNIPESLGYTEQVGLQGGLTALHYAVRDGRAEAARMLLDTGIDIDVRTGGDRTTPLLMTIINGNFDLAMELLERGADPTLATEDGVGPLFAALNNEWHLRTWYPQPTAQKQQETSYLELMRALLEAGADPNARTDEHIWYTAYNAGRMGVDFIGATPFWRAAYALDVEAMKLLVEYGADPDLWTIKPQSSRRRSRYGPGDDEEEEEDPSGLPPVPPGGNAVHPLHAAAGVGYGTSRVGQQHRHVPDGWLPAVRYLVEELGVDPNVRDDDGYSALHHAASRGDNETIEFLVEHGADVTVVSRRGQTTVDMANGPQQRVQPFPETIALLESLGAKNNHNCRSC